MQVQVLRNRYYFVHGKAPRGRNFWVFEIGDTHTGYMGPYKEAKKFAIKEAQRRNVLQIKVLP